MKFLLSFVVTVFYVVVAVAAVAVAAVAVKATDEVKSLVELNQYIEKHSNVSVGFLSEGNFHAVQNELHPGVSAVYFKDTDELHTAVETGIVFAGLVSGTPKDSRSLNVFPSEQVSVRAMLVKQGNDDILNAIDAALVRIIQAGNVEKIAASNSPYQALVVHSCKPTATHFEWPRLNKTKIKIAALGPYFWGTADGDYTKKPFKGFWPDYYNLIEAEFQKQYDITFERHWFKSSKGVLDSLANGETDTTEPYMMMGAAYKNLSRKTAFDMSCITSATQDKYFTLKYKPNNSTANKPPEVNTHWVIGIIVLGSILLGAAIFIMVLYMKEKQGKPLFKTSLLGSSSSVVIDNSHL